MEIRYSNLQNFQYQGFHEYVCSNGESNVNVQFDLLNLIRARAITPYNYTNGVYQSSIDDLTVFLFIYLILIYNLYI